MSGRAAEVVEAVAAAQAMPLPEAALLLAGRGAPVFPCLAGGKRPLTEHGLLDAAADPGRVREWWRRFPEANIGVPTGPVSGLDVVDVDVREGGSGFDALADAAAGAPGLGDGWSMVVATPSGGAHLYYPADPGRVNGSWVCAGAHVDFRGAGGYVIVPPSALDSPAGGRRYTVAGLGDEPRPIDAAALRERLEPGRRAARAGRAAGSRLAGRGSEARLSAWVAARAVGERNQALYWAACRMAEAGRGLDAAMDVLAPAAGRAGLGGRETAATIRSAYRRAHTPTAPPPAPSGGAPGRGSRVGRAGGAGLGAGL
ncbi:MAG: bifunctional DNA primase/polymerase [Bifidobacteriaceae bacterium]|nr:bifunctional DNA primase/polymerase [Bifidobacteriaceae bacterium]